MQQERDKHRNVVSLLRQTNKQKINRMLTATIACAKMEHREMHNEEIGSVCPAP